MSGAQAQFVDMAKPRKHRPLTDVLRRPPVIEKRDPLHPLFVPQDHVPNRAVSRNRGVGRKKRHTLGPANFGEEFYIVYALLRADVPFIGVDLIERRSDTCGRWLHFQVHMLFQNLGHTRCYAHPGSVCWTTGQKANYRLVRSMSGRVHPTRFRVLKRSPTLHASSV